MRRPGFPLFGLVCALLAFPLASHGSATTDTWSGTWSRAEDGVNGNLILVQAGSSVSGHYTWNDGSGHVSGTVSGTSFTGGFTETHYQGSFVLKLAGRKFTGSYSGKNKDTNGPISGPFDGVCIAGPCLQNGASAPAPSSAPAAQAGSLSGEVIVVHANGTRGSLTAGAALARGDRLETGVDSHVVLNFADGSRMTLPEMSIVQVADLTVLQSKANVSVSLKLGEVSEQVHPKKAYQTDFETGTQSGATAVRGTKISVFYDPGSRAAITAVTQHAAIVDPTKPGLPTVTVPAGKEVEVTPTSISPVAPLGKANSHGGIDRARAYALVVAALGKQAKTCQLRVPTTTAGFSVKPGGSGWVVTIPVSGKVTGLTTWIAAGAHVTPTNALARQITSGC